MVQTSYNYAFAHITLLQYAKRFSWRIFSCLWADGSFYLLDSIVDQVNRTFASLAPGLSSSEIQVTTHKFGDKPCLLFHLPPPQNPTEAFYVGIVSAIPEKQIEELTEAMVNDTSEFRKHPDWALRYFILERPTGLVPGQVSVLGEWENAARHLYRGSGPTPSPENFLQAINACIKN